MYCFVHLPAPVRPAEFQGACNRRAKENTTSGTLRCPSVASVLTLKAELSGTERSGCVALSLLNTWRRNGKKLAMAKISIGGLGRRAVFRQGFRCVEHGNTRGQELICLKVYQVFDVQNEPSHSEAILKWILKLSNSFHAFLDALVQ